MIYQGENIKADFIEPSIVELVFDCSGSVNKFDHIALTEFKKCIEILAVQIDAKALILTSAKPAFIVGADINEFIGKFALSDADLLAWIKHATDIFDALEDLPYPTISAVNGYALGGGCETILATDYRVLDTSATVGLPEVKLGIMPGFGGTVRLSRVIGADNAMEWITSGKNHKALDCLAVGFADAVVEPEQLRGSAIKLAQDLIKGDFAWQDKRNEKLSALNLSKVESAMSFNLAKALVFAKVGKHYPAPHAAIEAIEAGSSLNRREAMAIENKIFCRLAKTSEATAQVGVFLADQLIKSKAKKWAKESTNINQAAVLGAGIMGGGIAYQSSSKGVPITMKDVNHQALNLGLDEASSLLNKQIERGRCTPAKMAKVLNSILPSLSYDTVTDTDIVVEAVTENPKIKQSVLAECESFISEQAILASNTSTISISKLAEGLKRPERFCGMHFFNPVHRMLLVEVIRGDKTNDETVAKTVAYALQLGKTPIVVNDCPGFFVNRVLFPYFAGFNLLLAEGADFIQVDKVMEKQFGWPMGPAYLLDVVGLDTAFHAQKVMAEGFPSRMAMPKRNFVEDLYAKQRLGQKSAAGFYIYQKDKKGRLQKLADPEHSVLSSAATTQFSDDEIIARLMIPMINETIRCLEEKVIASAEEADMALIYGLGFPVFKGGIFRYLEHMGLSEFIKLADSYAALGEMYQVTEGLREKALTQSTYLNK